MKAKKVLKLVFGGLLAVLAIAVLWYLVIAARGCQKAVQEVTKTVEGKADAAFGERVKAKTKFRLFGQEIEPRVEITIPPQKDTVKIRVPGGKEVYGLPQGAEISVTKIPPALIRLKPSVHACVLTDLKGIDGGIKLRLLEVWRFGACGYLATCGIGAGADLRIVSNVSVGAARFLDRWRLEASVKL